MNTGLQREIKKLDDNIFYSGKKLAVQVQLKNFNAPI